MKETRTLEFKADITNTFLKTVSAFANYNGGKILFGVDDNGNVCGLSDPKQACLDIENKINDSIRPQPDYELSVQDADKTVTLTVHPGSGKPYLYKSKAYRRNDTATIEVDDLELTQLILEGKHMHFEDLPAESQDLTFHTLEEAAIREIGIKSLNQDILRTLNLYSTAKGYNRAAEILSDVNRYPGIDVVRFGESINIILRRETLEHQSILTELDQAVKIFRDYYRYEEIKGMKRMTVEQIPEDAYRETVANALIHRRWDMDSRIRIFMYDDRVEVYSPGGLPNTLSKEEYLRGQVSSLRNPIITNIFFRLHIVEALGTGVLRIQAAYEQSNRKPDFEITENSIKVTLPLVISDDVSEDEQKVLDALSRNTLKSMSEISEQLPFSRSKTSMLLKKLVEKNYVEVSGNGRGTKYRLK